MAITITPEALKKSAHQYKNELLMMMVIGIESTLKHMAPRLKVQYKQTWGEIAGTTQLGPYDPNRKNTSIDIKGRTLEVFLGSVIKEFDPNDVFQSIYGSLTLHGDGLKNVEITKAILASEIKSLAQKLNMAIFSAKRNNTGTTSQDLFNGFDTIAADEITAGNIDVAKKNLHVFSSAITNVSAVDLLKEFYRSASDELQSIPVKMFVPKSVKQAYEDDYQATVGGIAYNKEFNKTTLEGSEGLCEIVALPNKKDAPYIQLTTKSNMIVGCGATPGIETLDVDRFSPFMVTLSLAKVFGVQYETLSPEKLLIGKLV